MSSGKTIASSEGARLYKHTGIAERKTLSMTKVYRIKRYRPHCALRFLSFFSFFLTVSNALPYPLSSFLPAVDSLFPPCLGLLVSRGSQTNGKYM